MAFVSLSLPGPIFTGYVYRLRGKPETWRTAPDRRWETVMGEIPGKVVLVGYRKIDGADVAVFVVNDRKVLAVLKHMLPRGMR